MAQGKIKIGSIISDEAFEALSARAGSIITDAQMAALEASVAPKPVNSQPIHNLPAISLSKPIYEELGLPVGEPELLRRALDIPFIPGREIARTPGAFTEAEPFEIERKEASISDIGGKIGRGVLEKLHAMPGPKKILYEEGEIKPGDVGEYIGRMVAEMGIEIPVANVMISTLAGSIGSAAKQIISSNTWRMMKVPERRLVVQSLDDIAKGMEAQGLSEAQILRTMKNMGEDEAAFKRFAERQGIKIEPEPIPEPKVTPAPTEKAAGAKPYTHRPMTVEGGAARLDDLVPAFGEDIYGNNAVQYFGTGEKALDIQTLRILKSVRNKPDTEISVYRAVLKDTPSTKLSEGDWVTVNKKYAIEHGEGILEGNYKIIEQKVRAGDLTTSADSFHEQGYHPQPKPSAAVGLDPSTIAKKFGMEVRIEKGAKTGEFSAPKTAIINDDITPIKPFAANWLEKDAADFRSSKDYPANVASLHHEIAHGLFSRNPEAGHLALKELVSAGVPQDVAFENLVDLGGLYLLEPEAIKNNSLKTIVGKWIDAEKAPEIAPGEAKAPEKGAETYKGEPVQTKEEMLKATRKFFKGEKPLPAEAAKVEKPKAKEPISEEAARFQPVLEKPKATLEQTIRAKEFKKLTEVARGKVITSVAKEFKKDSKQIERYTEALKTAGLEQDAKIAEKLLEDDLYLDTEQRLINEEIKLLEKLTQKPGVPKAVKTTIREYSGQVKIRDIIEVDTRLALRDQIRFEARAAREAFSAGKTEEALKHKEKQLSLTQRRRALRTISDYFGIPDNIMKKVAGNRDIGLMSNYQFKQFKEDIRIKAVELMEQSEAKARLIKLISDKRLKRYDNYRKAMELPPISQMTTAQLEQFESLLEPFSDGDVFLSERELETVDRTDLKGIRTWREAREKLAQEVGISVEELEKIKISELDDYRYDTALAEKNPFYKMLVTESTRKILEGDARYYAVEAKAHTLAKKAEKSRKRSLVERAIPQDKGLMDYMEAPEELKNILAQELTPEQLDYAHYMQEYFSNALDYLIKTKALTKGRENYFVHMRRTFLEVVKDEGLVAAAKSVFKNYIQDEAIFNILDDATGDILPLEKFFQFALHRTGELTPTANITRAFTGYVRLFERKVAFDELIPKLDIYAQSLTPERLTPRGLEVDRSIKQFVNKYINNKKGRRIRWIAKQHGEIDMTIRAARTFTTILDLGLNIPVGLASIIGEQATTLQGVGVKTYALGIKRLGTEQGKKIVEANKAFVGKSIFDELVEPGKEISTRLMEGVFGLFRVASVTANKQFLLGSLTAEEFRTGTVSSKRLAELKVDMGRWRKVSGAESLVGKTGAGGAAVQYKTWAVPILRTATKNLITFLKDIKTKPAGEALKTREAEEVLRFVLISSAVAIIGGVVVANQDDRSFIGQLRSKAYRELSTLMQGVGVKLWLSVPRVLIFLQQLGVSLQQLLTLEEYKTKPGLKGVAGLKRQLTPQVVKQFTREGKKKRGFQPIGKLPPLKMKGE